jgi:hypothetical protein
MLAKLSSEIGDCLARAAEARQRAEETTDAQRRADHLRQERSWSHLASSYQFAESLDRFLYGSAAAGDGWQPVSTAPFDRPLELAVIDGHADHALVFPCCRAVDGWIAAQTGSPIDVVPTHWREWIEIEPHDRRPAADGGGEAAAPNGRDLVIFKNDEATLRVGRGDNDLFELVFQVHGEEITAYDLDGDRLATIGRRLLTLAKRA